MSDHPPGSQAPPPYQPQPPVQQAPRNGLGIAALILGIIGAVSGIIPLLFWLAGILGLIGLILGFAGRARAKRGEATNGTTALWGIITSVLALILAVVGLVLLVVAVDEVVDSSAGAGPATTAAGPSTPEPEAAQDMVLPDEAAAFAGSIGDPVRDGQFEFTVTGVEPPVETVGEDFLAEEAQGQFIIVRVTVTNVGDEARTLDASSQYLYDADGRKFETSSALFSLEDADQVFLENINPGNTVADAPLLYDVPDGFVPEWIELHDSAFSGGVAVALS